VRAARSSRQDDVVETHRPGIMASQAWAWSQETTSGHTAACAWRPRRIARCCRLTPISPGYSMRRAYPSAIASTKGTIDWGGATASALLTTASGQWGLACTHDRIKRSDLDPALLIWGLRKRVDLGAFSLPGMMRGRAAGSPRRPALRIFRRPSEPHEIPNHVADPWTIGRRRLHGGRGICRRSYTSRQYP
jgi:hypothetical protein